MLLHFLIINLWEFRQSLDSLPASNLLYTPFQQSFKLKFSQHLLRRVHRFIFTFKFELIYYSKLRGNKLSNENSYRITGCSTSGRPTFLLPSSPKARLLKIKNQIAVHLQQKSKLLLFNIFHRILMI